MTSIRITGTESEIEEALDVIRDSFEVRSVSKFYRNREGFGAQRRPLPTGRVYVEVDP